MRELQVEEKLLQGKIENLKKKLGKNLNKKKKEKNEKEKKGLCLRDYIYKVETRRSQFSW